MQLSPRRLSPHEKYLSLWLGTGWLYFGLFIKITCELLENEVHGVDSSVLTAALKMRKPWLSSVAVDLTALGSTTHAGRFAPRRGWLRFFRWGGGVGSVAASGSFGWGRNGDYYSQKPFCKFFFLKTSFPRGFGFSAFSSPRALPPPPPLPPNANLPCAVPSSHQQAPLFPLGASAFPSFCWSVFRGCI